MEMVAAPYQSMATPEMRGKMVLTSDPALAICSTQARGQGLAQRSAHTSDPNPQLEAALEYTYSPVLGIVDGQFLYKRRFEGSQRG